MSFDSFAGDLGKPQPKATPKEVEETLDMGLRLTNTDFIDKLRMSENLNKIEQVKKIIEELGSMNLYKRGWRFQFGTSKQWAGLCSAVDTGVHKSKENKNLFVSINFVRGDDTWMTKMKSVVYHEIAHAIVREMFDDFVKLILLGSLDPSHKATQGHGQIWKMVCEAIREEDCECQMYYTGMVANDLFLPYRYCCTFCANKQYGKNKFFAMRCSKCKSPIVIENNTI